MEVRKTALAGSSGLCQVVQHSWNRALPIHAWLKMFSMDIIIRNLAMVQAVYYAITGIWPVVHINSFMEVTGPKTDLWLVKLIGGLTVSISVVVFFTGIRRRIHIESLLVIIISSISYLLTDIINVARGLINTIYLADAVLQIFFISAWLALAIKQKPVRHG